MTSPAPPGSPSSKLGGFVALVITILLLIVVIILAVYFSASSSVVTTIGLILGVVGAFFSFLQAFPKIGQQVASIFLSRPSFNLANNKLPVILLIFIALLLISNIIQGVIIYHQGQQGTLTPTLVTHVTPLTATSIVTPINTAITTPPDTTPTVSSPTNLLYQANWSQGMNGWRGSSQWSAKSGMLMSNGNAQQMDFIVAPYQPTTPNYAVEAQIQFLQNTSYPDPKLFGLFVRSGSNENQMGYDGYLYSGNAKIRIAHDPNSNVLTATAYTLDASLHTYRLEIKDSMITLLIDGIQIVQTTDSTFTTPGLLGLFDNSCQINVRSFTVFQI